MCCLGKVAIRSQEGHLPTGNALRSIAICTHQSSGCVTHHYSLWHPKQNKFYFLQQNSCYSLKILRGYLQNKERKAILVVLFSPCCICSDLFLHHPCIWVSGQNCLSTTPGLYGLELSIHHPLVWVQNCLSSIRVVFGLKLFLPYPCPLYFRTVCKPYLCICFQLFVLHSYGYRLELFGCSVEMCQILVCLQFRIDFFVLYYCCCFGLR